MREDTHVDEIEDLADAAAETADRAEALTVETIGVPVDIIRGIDARLSEYAGNLAGLREAQAAQAATLGVLVGSIDRIEQAALRAGEEAAETAEDATETVTAAAGEVTEDAGEVTPVVMETPAPPKRRRGRGMIRSRRK